MGKLSKSFYGDEGCVECHKGKIFAILATFGLFWLLFGCFGQLLGKLNKCFYDELMILCNISCDQYEIL